MTAVPTPQHPRYLRTAQAAVILHVAPRTVSAWASRGWLPFKLTFGGHRRFEEATLRRIAAEMETTHVPATTIWRRHDD
jgi:excisionase family DNA binding protein